MLLFPDPQTPLSTLYDFLIQAQGRFHETPLIAPTGSYLKPRLLGDSPQALLYRALHPATRYLMRFPAWLTDHPHQAVRLFLLLCLDLAYSERIRLHTRIDDCRNRVLRCLHRMKDRQLVWIRSFPLVFGALLGQVFRRSLTFDLWCVLHALVYLIL